MTRFTAIVLFLTMVVTFLSSIPAVYAVDVSANDQTSVSFQADDQETSVLLPTLSALAGERYEPVIDLLLQGITATRASFVLSHASPASCRQALAFALDCWWVYAADEFNKKIWLTTQPKMPLGAVSTRSMSSSLRQDAGLQTIAETVLSPWLGDDCGISFLPTERLWTATLDEAGHRRLVELLSILERPLAVASSLVPDADIIDLRRVMLQPIYATSWSSLLTLLSQSAQISVSLSPQLRLRTFPQTNISLAKTALGDLDKSLAAYELQALWQHGVLCLGEKRDQVDDADHEHPAQRRHLALIPIGHLITNAVEGELIASVLRNKVAPWWWKKSGAALHYLEPARALLIGADIPTQQHVLQGLNALDRLGLELGVETLGKSSQP
jgi:hypothetical protein